MSWIDRLRNVEVTIRTGDGRVYRPLWITAQRSKKYNYSAYNFINRAGTLVDRREPEGYQYDFEIHFTGQDHIDVARNFEISSDDKRFWTITHPYYGEIRVQPLGYTRNDTQRNKTTFVIQIWETITSNYPVERLVADDQVQEFRTQTNEQALQNFGAQVPEIDAATRASAMDALQQTDTIVSAAITDDTLFAQFKTLIAQGRQRLTDSLNQPIDTMRSVLRAINYPIDNINSVRERFDIYRELQQQFFQIIMSETNGGDSSARDALLYELLGSTIIAAMSNSALTPGDGDFQIRSEVAEVAEQLRNEYGIFIGNLDSIQAERSDLSGSFTPDDFTNRLLSETALTTFANLFDIAFEARQERNIVLEKDSNAIILTHRFYGLDEADENLQFFIDSNNLTLDELLQIKKGRIITYYS